MEILNPKKQERFEQCLNRTFHQLLCENDVAKLVIVIIIVIVGDRAALWVNTTIAILLPRLSQKKRLPPPESLLRSWETPRTLTEYTCRRDRDP